jgi:ABC-type uncharacterized transport system fused permease/ATPase subunit
VHDVSSSEALRTFGQFEKAGNRHSSVFFFVCVLFISSGFVVKLFYPAKSGTMEDARLLSVLRRVNLSDLHKRVGGLDGDVDFSQILSLGEQQRLAFARLSVSKPKFVVLDESTSALGRWLVLCLFCVCI